MFASQHAPIAIDFGSSSVKLMQLDRESPPNLIAAAELVIPESLRPQPAAALQHVGAELPGLLRTAGFKGKKVVTAIPSAQTFTQHMQIQDSPGVKLEEIVKGQLEMQMNCAPGALVVRTIPVKDAKCRDQSRMEVICFAAAREVIMRYVRLLNQCKLDVTGMHTEALSTIWSFAHVNRGEDADAPTLYVNMGWRGTLVTIGHGTKIVFARYIHIGGHHFDQQIAARLKCEQHEASAQRLTMEQPLAREGAVTAAACASDGAESTADGLDAETASVATATPDSSGPSSDLLDVPMSGEAAAIIERFDFSELIDMLVDDVSMCLRYHRGLFPNQTIARTVLVGGESRQPWLTRTVTDHLNMTTHIGDPLHRYHADEGLFTPGLNRDEPHPGWAVASGLCFAPTDA